MSSKKTKRSVGRPALPANEKQIETAVSLPRELRDFAKSLGSGKLSRGVQIALTEAMERRKTDAV